MKLLYYGIIMCFCISKIYSGEGEGKPPAKPNASPTPPLALTTRTTGSSSSSSGSTTPKFVFSPRGGATAPQKQRPGSASEGSTTNSTRHPSPIKPFRDSADSVDDAASRLYDQYDPASVTTPQTIQGQAELLENMMVLLEIVAAAKEQPLAKDRKEHEQTLFEQLKDTTVQVQAQQRLLQHLLRSQTSLANKLTQCLNDDFRKLGVTKDQQAVMAKLHKPHKE